MQVRVSAPEHVLFIQHQNDAPPGYVGERLAALGAHIKVCWAQQPLPDPGDYDLIIPLGSDDSVADESVPYLAAERDLVRSAVESAVPVFGICFGAQLLSQVLGGEVGRAPSGPEIGWILADTHQPGLVESGPWLTWHLDLMTVPPGGAEIARSRHSTQAFSHGPHIGTQFHPEATTASVRAWAHKYSSALNRAGVDHDELLAQTDELEAQARQRASTLTDRVLDHAGFRRDPRQRARD